MKEPFGLDPALYSQLRPRMLAYLERRKCYWAEEVADEALKRVWERVQTDPPDNVPAFAYGVVRLVYLEWQRKESRHTSLERAGNVCVTFDPISDEERRRFHEAAGMLSEADREFLAMYLACEDGSASLARALGITPEGVRSRVFRLKQRLREALNPETKPSPRDTTSGSRHANR